MSWILTFLRAGGRPGERIKKYVDDFINSLVGLYIYITYGPCHYNKYHQQHSDDDQIKIANMYINFDI